jgi:hypothetical protein
VIVFTHTLVHGQAARTTYPKIDKDNQFVLDVIEEECTLEGGGCDCDKRICDRAKDIVNVMIPIQGGDCYHLTG